MKIDGCRSTPDDAEPLGGVDAEHDHAVRAGVVAGVEVAALHDPPADGLERPGRGRDDVRRDGAGGRRVVHGHRGDLRVADVDGARRSRQPRRPRAARRAPTRPTGSVAERALGAVPAVAGLRLGHRLRRRDRVELLVDLARRGLGQPDGHHHRGDAQHGAQDGEQQPARPRADARRGLGEQVAQPEPVGPRAPRSVTAVTRSPAGSRRRSAPGAAPAPRPRRRA